MIKNQKSPHILTRFFLRCEKTEVKLPSHFFSIVFAVVQFCQSLYRQLFRAKKFRVKGDFPRGRVDRGGAIGVISSLKTHHFVLWK